MCNEVKKCDKLRLKEGHTCISFCENGWMVVECNLIVMILFWIIKLFEGLPKFLRGNREGLYKKSNQFMRFFREGLI